MTHLQRLRVSRPLIVVLSALAVALLLTAQAAFAVGTGGSTTASRARPLAGSGSCTSPGVFFCEDFDALDVGATTGTTWTADTTQGSLTVEPSATGSRDNVLHVHADGHGRALLTVDGLAVPDNSYFGRMWVNVDAFPTAPDFAHFVLVQATGTGSTEIVRPVGGQFINTQFLQNGGVGRSLLGIGADGGPTGDWTDWRETATAVAGSWQCVEWSWQAADNTVQLIVNGVANPDLVVSTNTHGGNAVPFVLPTVTKIQIGWQLFQADPTPAAYDLRYDTIALSTTRIGCGSPPEARPDRGEPGRRLPANRGPGGGR